MPLLKAVLSKSHTAHGVTAEANKLIFEELRVMESDFQNLRPIEFYRKWLKPVDGSKSPIETIGENLTELYPVALNPGFRKSTKKDFFTQNARGFSLDDFIREKYNFSMHYTNRHTITFDGKKYLQLCAVATAMAIARYDVSTLTSGHIYYQCLGVLFRYFRLFDNETWFVNNADLNNALCNMMETDISVFTDIARRYNFMPTSEVISPAKPKRRPTCREDLTECFSPGMTQKEKTAAIVKWWRCGESTARRYMSKYGLTDQDYTRSDYKELHAHISDEADALHEHLDENKEEITKLTDKIDSLTSAVESVQLSVNDAFDKWLKQQSGGYHSNRLKCRDTLSGPTLTEDEARARINAAFSTPITPASNE